jgi:hypothetical protein
MGWFLERAMDNRTHKSSSLLDTGVYSYVDCGAIRKQKARWSLQSERHFALYMMVGIM